uniref:Uncharacterized protein n=1 Tax=Acrobeloides nanus TaxID=290746 RepID=A0A914CZZ5_9BILA
MYLHSSGLLSCLNLKNEQSVISETMHAWLLFEMCLTTLRNGGLQIKRVFTVNEKYFDINEDKMLSMYSTDPNLKNTDAVSR